VRITEEELAEDGGTTVITDMPVGEEPEEPGPPEIVEPPTEERRKLYFDGGQVEVAARLVYELDPNGKQLRVVRYTDYAAETVG
jgi:type I restriction enzyme R subunit